MDAASPDPEDVPVEVDPVALPVEYIELGPV
jgi:hypothetical protein